MKPLLSVENLNVTLGGRVVIPGLTFDVREGDCLAIIGPNGAGKTVLLKALLGLVRYGGQVHWCEGAHLGYVPQKVSLDRQLPLSARDVLQAKARLLKLAPAEFEQVLATLRLTQAVLNGSLGSLSGGQFQKVLIAFALLGKPSVLLIDEPTASLDELSEEHVYDLLHSLQKERGLTVLLVSHELNVVYRYANMVLCLSRTKPCLGPPTDILTPATLRELYSDTPHYHLHVHGPGEPDSASHRGGGERS